MAATSRRGPRPRAAPSASRRLARPSHWRRGRRGPVRRLAAEAGVMILPGSCFGDRRELPPGLRPGFPARGARAPSRLAGRWQRRDQSIDRTGQPWKQTTTRRGVRPGPTSPTRRLRGLLPPALEDLPRRPLWVPPIKSSARDRAQARDQSLPRATATSSSSSSSADGEAVGRIAAMVDRLAIEAWGKQDRHVRLLRVRPIARAPRERGRSSSARRATGCASGAWRRCAGPGPSCPRSGAWSSRASRPSALIMAPYNPPRVRGLARGLRPAQGQGPPVLGAVGARGLPDPRPHPHPDRRRRRSATSSDAHDRLLRVTSARSSSSPSSRSRPSRTTGAYPPSPTRRSPPWPATCGRCSGRSASSSRRNEKGEDVGFALSIPDVNVILKKTRGRMLPFGWARLLLGIPRLRRYRMFALGVAADVPGQGRRRPPLPRDVGAHGRARA